MPRIGFGRLGAIGHRFGRKRDVPPVDVVYIWADGSDPAFKTSLLACRADHVASRGSPPDPESVSANRFRDLDNLRYSLRSLEANAPWFRRIFVVTNGQVPRWLVRDDRVEVVSVEDIAPPGQILPTFNATAIEWSIPRIPGLSRFYLFMNDDYFLLRPTSLDYFFGTNRLPKILFSPTAICRVPAGPTLWDRLATHQAKLLTQRLGDRDWHQAAHGPCLIDSIELSRVRSMWEREVEETQRHRFREATDAHLQILYANALAALNDEKDPALRHERHVISRAELSFISMGNPDAPWQRHLRKALKRRPRFLCLNDDGPAENFDAIEAAHRAFLEQLFPRPSSFEETIASCSPRFMGQLFGRASRM